VGRPGYKVAIKTHFGEKGNETRVKPEYIKPVVDRLKTLGSKPYLTETSVLYKSERENALDHIMLAYDHGFTYENVGAPIIMSDGFLGNFEKELPVDGEYYQKVSVAGDVLAADSLIVVSHVTGHILAGFGAALKNLGMGLSSRKGKLNQHSQISPEVNPPGCTACKKCLRWCPNDAISMVSDKAWIDSDKCIGCGECITVCRFDAIQVSWNQASDIMQKKMVEHAAAIIREKEDKILYINLMVHMTQNCDCMVNKEPMIDDIGILASFDPVAIDQATLDLTQQANQDNISEMSYPDHDPLVQIEHAALMGIGSRKVELIKL